MDNLEDVADELRANMESLSATRDRAYERSRALTSLCARAIRAVHREEWVQAERLIGEARLAAGTLVDDLQPFPVLYYAGYTQDALKEYAEAQLTLALVRDHPLPSPSDLAIEDATWLNGLAEAATELRRRILDIIRLGHSAEAERLLDHMDAIYSVLVTFDFSDGVTGGLRRRTDLVRGVLERTRGDMTTSFRQAALEQALEALEARLTRATGGSER